MLTYQITSVEWFLLEVQWLIHSTQYSNPTEINKGELAEPVHLSTVRMLEDSNAQSAL